MSFTSRRTTVPIIAFHRSVNGINPFALAVSRQTARKVAAGLVERDFAPVLVGTNDTRRRNIDLTPLGRRYADAVIDVIHALDEELIAKIDPVKLESARHVLAFRKDSFGP